MSDDNKPWTAPEKRYQMLAINSDNEICRVTDVTPLKSTPLLCPVRPGYCSFHCAALGLAKMKEWPKVGLICHGTPTPMGLGFTAPAEFIQSKLELLELGNFARERLEGAE